MITYVADALFRQQARRRLRRLESATLGRAQLRTLLDLVHANRTSPFGLAHDFARIRSVADFRRLVPMRSLAELTTLPEAVWPGTQATSWLEVFRYQPALETVVGDTPRLPISRELLQSSQQCLWTAFGQALQARPDLRLLSGTILQLGDGVLTPLSIRHYPEAIEANRAHFPWLLHPFTRFAPAHTDEDLVALLEGTSPRDVTALLIGADTLTRLVEMLRGRNGLGLKQLWPKLAVVFYSRTLQSPPTETLRELIGPGVLSLETYIRPEGLLALEDPRLGKVRLLADHGVYYELVHTEELGRRQPERLGLHEAMPGVVYALAVTSPAGLWSCQTGLNVCFEQIDPPVLRSLEVRPASSVITPIFPIRTEQPHAELAPPHPRKAGTAGGTARRFSRSLWSERGGPG